MANKKKRIDKSEKDMRRHMLKVFTSATANVIYKNLHDIPMEDIFTDIFVVLKTDNLKYLNKEYEKALLLSVVDFKRFESSLHEFYTDMAKQIKDKKMVWDFYELCFQIYKQLDKKSHSPIVDAYKDLLMQQSTYIVGNAAKSVYGVKSNGELLYMDEPRDNIAIINYEFSQYVDKNGLNYLYMVDLFRKYGYKEVKTIFDTEGIMADEQILNNSLFFMAPVINEDVRDIIKKPFSFTAKGLFENNWKRMVYVDVDKLTEKLQLREYLLPSEGVTVHFHESDVLKELYFKEIFRGDSIILLWRMKKLDDTYFFGYYDTSSSIAFSPWKDTTSTVETHIPLMSIILQHYLKLTTPLLKEEEAELFHFHDTNEPEKPGLIAPKISYSIKESVPGKPHETRTRPFDRKKYIADLVNINPFLRNLPQGAVASDEAIERARRMGINLPPGKTLVKGFSRKSWHKKEGV